MPTTLRLTPDHLARIRAHIASEPQHEVCGLVGGRWRPYPRLAIAATVAPIPNIDPLPQVRYTMQPAAQVRTMAAWAKQGWEVVAIYHSHPLGEAAPSPSDRAEWHYTDALMLIGVPGGALAGWRLRKGTTQPILIEMSY